MNERVVAWADEGRYLIREAETLLNADEVPDDRPEPQSHNKRTQKVASSQLQFVALDSHRLMSLTIKTNLGYYDNTNFHRNIKGFMIQGGDPTGTGKGGQSIYGGYFEDEFVSTLKHERRGCLSMVNTGPNTNGSQFFVTYSRQPHLNGVYTTFGRLIDGLDTLDKMEKEPINAKNRPMRPIKIESIVIHANPIADEEAQQ
ncbi:CYP10 [Symbiodinium pilosum]|uniref:Peptidyl-prolyl cis-trans isomerase n=1 Tax=Symbiodinium pilosum TaxID=2952 RepID=A0A812P4S0_SYMPI|nr:CYP10 [Symbiodinium pilosum]